MEMICSDPLPKDDMGVPSCRSTRRQRLRPLAPVPATSQPVPSTRAVKGSRGSRAAPSRFNWPPTRAAYDYVLTLNDEEIAWEGLRRNPDYQRHYRLSGAGHASLAVCPPASPSGASQAVLRLRALGPPSLLSIRP